MRIAIVAFFSILPALAAAQAARAPYLQQGTSDGMTIVWRTVDPADSIVCWGDSPTTLTNRVAGASAVRDHVVRIGGLAAETRYYYAVSDSGACPPTAASNPDAYFTTSPPPGMPSPFRFWVLGDSGTGGTRQRLVFESMLADVGDERPDLFVHVGDMAYSSGTTAEFDATFFAVYESLLANTPCWPAIGNHEALSSDSSTESGPYYEAYVLPTDGSGGGFPSGTEAYYSFDYANVHFIVLDSAESSRQPAGPMALWLMEDLRTTAQEWLVAFWHHPPYSDGTHTDSEYELREMRENILPILEAAGVDLVLTGHSHIYERSFLLHGAYTSTDAVHIVDPGDGRQDGDGPYRTMGDGTLYVVAGHGGAGIGGNGAHPLMYETVLDHGSCIVDVNGSALTLRNVPWDGEPSERDYVTLVREDGIVLIAPAGGETFLAGRTVDVTWASSATSGEVRIEYSLDDGRSWTTAVDRTADDGHYAWTTPRRASTLCRVRVSDVAAPSVYGSNLRPFALAAEGSIDAIASGSVWEYSDTNVAPSADWLSVTGGWPSGPAQLGFGDNDEATVVQTASPNTPTYYFRRALIVDEEVTAARVRVLYDDGFALFVNGTRVLERNVADGIDHATYASAGSSDNAIAEGEIDPALLRLGENVIAVVVKQGDAISSDLSFDLSLSLSLRVALDPDPPDAGPAPNEDAGTIADAGMEAVPGGCGCRTVGARTGASTASMFFFVLAMLFLNRRRFVGLTAGLFLSGCLPPVAPASAWQRSQVRITMYTTQWCPACAGARSWLHDRGIPFSDIDVESSASGAARLRSLNRSGTVPTIDVEGHILVGFVPEELRYAVDRAAHRH